MSAELLDDLGLEGEVRPWTLPDGVDERFVPAGLLLGQGQNPLEVVLAMTSDRPAAGAVRTLWEKRRGKRASPVFCVTVYRQSGTMRAAACGPSGDDPRVAFGLDLGQVGRICDAALAEPDRHAAARLVAETLPRTTPISPDSATPACSRPTSSAAGSPSAPTGTLPREPARGFSPVTDATSLSSSASASSAATRPRRSSAPTVPPGRSRSSFRRRLPPRHGAEHPPDRRRSAARARPRARRPGP